MSYIINNLFQKKLLFLREYCKEIKYGIIYDLFYLNDYIC